MICNVHMKAPFVWSAASGTLFGFLVEQFNKKAVNTTPRWELAGEKTRQRKGGRALCVPQRSINTLKALNPKSITISQSPGWEICLLLFHQKTKQ